MTEKAQKVVRFAVIAFTGLAIFNIASIAGAAPPAVPVPEIDPTSAASALAVLTGAGLMLAERFGFRSR